MSRNKKTAAKYVANKEDKKGNNKYERSSKSNSKGHGKDSRHGGTDYPSNHVSDDSSLAGRGSSDNDPIWYMKNEQLFRDASQYWLSLPTGLPLDFGANASASIGLKSVATRLKVTPGILVLDWVPSLGNIDFDDGSGTSTITENSTANTFAKNMLNWLVHANSRNYDYDAPDIAMAVFAADNIYSIIAAMVRAYGIARVFEQSNRYLGDAILSALGFDPSSVYDDISNFREKINTLVALASTVWVPNDIDMIKRHYWLNTNVYMDSVDITGQMYAYRQAAYFTWQPKTSSQGSYLSATVWSGAKTVQQWYNQAKSMLDSILNDADPQMMMGDMLKAYGADRLFALQPITESYVVMPTFNPEVLLQMHNTDIAYMDDTILATIAFEQNASDGNIYQVYRKALTWSTQYAGYRLLDFPSDYKVDAAAIMVATRNKHTVNEAWVTISGTLSYCPTIKCGTELFVNATVYSKAFQVNNVPTPLPLYGLVFDTQDGSVDLSNAANIGFMSKFDYAPFVYMGKHNSSSSDHTLELHHIFGDVNKGMPISSINVNRLNDVAVLSELNVPFRK